MRHTILIVGASAAIAAAALTQAGLANAMSVAPHVSVAHVGPHVSVAPHVEAITPHAEAIAPAPRPSTLPGTFIEPAPTPHSWLSPWHWNYWRSTAANCPQDSPKSDCTT